MEYSLEVLAAIAQANSSVANEMEARDTVMRSEMDAATRGKRYPWSGLGREGLRQEEFDLWLQLHNNTCTESTIIEKMTELMEQYYGMRYPLKKLT